MFSSHSSILSEMYILDRSFQCPSLFLYSLFSLLHTNYTCEHIVAWAVVWLVHTFEATAFFLFTSSIPYTCLHALMYCLNRLCYLPYTLLVCMYTGRWFACSPKCLFWLACVCEHFLSLRIIYTFVIVITLSFISLLVFLVFFHCHSSSFSKSHFYFPVCT